MPSCRPAAPIVPAAGDPRASLRAHAEDKLADLAARDRRRLAVETRALDAVTVTRGGRRLVNVSSNDYLGLAHDPRVIAAAQAAAAAHGTGAGASRLITGEHPEVVALEAELAAFKGAEAALVFSSGYAANLGIVSALAGRSDLIVIDDLAHNCLHMGARLSGATVHRFAHNDAACAHDLLARHRSGARHALLLTDGVFSMDGDRAPVAALARVAAAHDAWLLVDDAHGLGVVAAGRGAAAGADVPLAMGTLSKALGSQGGYVCADRPVVELLRNRARSFVYSTGLAPASAAAARAALAIVVAEPERCARPQALAARVAEALGLPAPDSPVLPIVLGAEQAALDAQAALEARGYLGVAVRPPTVPPGTARLRISLSAALSDAQVAGLIDALRAVLAETGGRAAR
ncbi:8-amino-7-oxononanoate synthase [Rhodothalassium salexigens]|uniref:aminotransferase class I/II-fold pyridoxal phosphate-dependent enzyme n=1 Tax=Rhodothalassium salexigens TaxID=1086 RepID=UPI0019134B55|nr:aminotransferase class I/II-fold pyridoxal phosphate-dependent enzyme [Rhodothalassium salexigens]MBK5919739.1 8-amino-7-oxononanoate synthase [Rhodothalassium salexigens]